MVISFPSQTFRTYSHTMYFPLQLKTIVGKAKSFFQNNFRDDYLMSLGNLIKGYMPEDIKKISNDSFK